MRILLVSQYFYPENFKANDIAFEMAKRGHTVDVLTSIPNYPEGKFYKGYGLFSKKRETINGVNVYRIFTIPRGHNKICLMLNYLTFWLWGIIRAFFFNFSHKYDCVVVHQTSPIMQAYPGIVISRLQKIPLYMWILDIWPDSMVSGGGIHNKSIVNAMNKMVTNIYARCSKILISSKGFRELVNRNGDFDDKIIYFPNWSEDLLKLPKVEIPQLPEGFRIMMAGNLGGAQRLEDVLKAAYLLRDAPQVKWIFVGDGSKRTWMESFIEEHHLQDTVFLVGRHPFSEMPAYFACANAMLVTLKADFPHLKAVVPARLQSYMSAGRPVLAMANGGVPQIIQDANCGFTAPAGDPETFVRIIKEQVLPNLASFEQLGENGRKYFEQYFTKEYCMDNFEKIIS